MSAPHWVTDPVMFSKVPKVHHHSNLGWVILGPFIFLAMSIWAIAGIIWLACVLVWAIGALAVAIVGHHHRRAVAPSRAPGHAVIEVRDLTMGSDWRKVTR